MFEYVSVFVLVLVPKFDYNFVYITLDSTPGILEVIKSTKY